MKVDKKMFCVVGALSLAMLPLAQVQARDSVYAGIANMVFKKTELQCRYVNNDASPFTIKAGMNSSVSHGMPDNDFGQKVPETMYVDCQVVADGNDLGTVNYKLDQRDASGETYKHIAMTGNNLYTTYGKCEPGFPNNCACIHRDSDKSIRVMFMSAGYLSATSCEG